MTVTPFGEKVDTFMVQMFRRLKKTVDAVRLLTIIVVCTIVSNTPVGRNRVAELNEP
jgi:hypothetical protein